MSLVFLICWTLFGSSHALDLLPNLDQMQYGFNILRGQTPSEQRKSGAQEKLFDFSGGTTVTLNGVQYIKPSELKDYSATFECFWRGVSNEVTWATSSASLKSQSKSSQTGYDQTSTIGVSVPVGAAEVSGETEIRNALVFGNSKTSSESFTQRDYGRTFSYDANGARFLYMAEVDWAREISSGEWDTHFKAACTALGSSPSDSALIGFFQEYGTHGLAKAQFGQKCTASNYIREGKTMSEYTDFMQTDSSAEASLFWFSHSSSSSESSSSETTNGQGFRYVTSDKHCVGSLRTDSNCGSGLKGNGVEDRPGINEVHYKPIWDMNVPGLSSGAKSKMQNLMQRMFTAQADCGRSSCNGRGLCRSKLNLWYSKSTAMGAASNLANFWDTSGKCFCNDDRIGSRCENRRDIVLEGPAFPGSYQNDWDSPLNVRRTQPLCGVNSVHDNGKEDRRFKLATCAISEPAYQSYSGEYQLLETNWDARFQRECPGHMVISGMYSYHNNGKEDRRWKIYCRNFGGTATQDCQWDGSYVNDWDRPVAKSCPNGKVLAGVIGWHDNGKEDRRWKYKCCEMGADSNNYYGLNENSVGYQNNWDSSHDYRAYVNGRYAAIAGVSSYHDNGKEDRRFKFWTRLSTNNPSRGSERYIGETNWDATWTMQCNGDEAIVRWSSYHNNGKEDRRFKFWCARFSGVSIGQCYWSDYKDTGGWSTNWDASWTYKCTSGYVLSGVQSTHNNGKEDRLWNFKCCRFMSASGHRIIAQNTQKTKVGSKAAMQASVLSAFGIPVVAVVSWLLIVALWKFSAHKYSFFGQKQVSVALASDDGYGACKA